MIKRLLADNNINLLQCGFKIIVNLSKGLKRGFYHVCKTFITPLFSKLRDKKNSIIEEAHAAIKACFEVISMDDIMEEIKQGL